jgi:predicted DNA-binding protein with PD1-like motif
VNVVTSHSTRTLVVRFARGESLIESIATLARDHGVAAATLVGHGVLQTATVESYDPRARAYNERRAFAGTLALTNLTGHVLFGAGEPVVTAQATLARETDNGLEVLGGHLLDAQVVAVDVTVFVHEDVRLTVVVDPATGLPAWRAEGRDGAVARAVPAAAPVVTTTRPQPVAARPAPASAPPPAREVTPARDVAPARASLADVARALEAMPARPERDADLGGDTDIQPGDLLDHPAWGECDVLREQEPGTFDIRIKSRGSTRTIKTEIFEVTPRPPREGKRVWGLKPRGK